MSDELESAALPHTLQPMRTPLDDMVGPCTPAEALAAARRLVGPHAAWDCLVLAWHHEH